MRHRGEHLMLRVRVGLLPRVLLLMLAVVLAALERAAEAGHGARARGRAEGHRGRIAVVVRQQATGAMDGARDS